MELTEDQIFEKYGKNAYIVIVIAYYHMNMNSVV